MGSNNHIVIQEISDKGISLNINGQVQEIKSQLSELKELIKSQEGKTVQYADKIYNIESINEANFGLLSGKMSFNEILTAQLIAAIQAYSKDAQTLLGYMQRNNIQDWAGQEKYAKKAKEILAYSYVGVIGMQLSHLMGIGKDNRVRSEEKIIPYIEKCLLIARYSLDLICFAFISRLWDKQKDNTLSLDEAQRAALSKFFERKFEPTFTEQVALIQVLYPIFTADSLPFEEMKDFTPHFEEGSSFQQSITKLQALKTMKSDKYTFVECAEAEAQLSNVMSHFSFLANYNMASIKRVGYKFLRNTEPHYIHNYIELGFDQKANPDVEKHRYLPEGVPTDTVLIHQGEDYQKSINLFPFVIDYNALTFEQGAKIYFYQCLNFQDENVMEYTLLKDDEVQKIEFQDIKAQNLDFNELVGDTEKLKILNIDHVLLQFREAHTSLTAQSEAKDEDFEALF